jgi:hypothetical protein
LEVAAKILVGEPERQTALLQNLGKGNDSEGMNVYGRVEQAEYVTSLDLEHLRTSLA